jgi:nucleotidyltransferase/DNA polymerase involved in DNA repair
MSVLACDIPDFVLTLAQRQQSVDSERPQVWLSPTGQVAVASPLARECGVSVGLSLRQALLRCPTLQVKELPVQVCEDAHATLLSTLAQTGLPVEAPSWGSAYVDLHSVTLQHSSPQAKADAQTLCADLGRQVRHALGQSLQPALGWDTGKFTARAAALRTPAGQMRLVSAEDEVRFLNPLPLILLPLPEPAVQQLYWLGIRTLGRFARLPKAAVQQRFGRAGTLAQQWAQGRDDRPVRPTVNACPEPITVDLDAPTSVQAEVLTATMHTLTSHLRQMSERLEGCRRLHATLHFVDGSTRTLTHVALTPQCAPSAIRAMLAHELQRLTWPTELCSLDVMLLDMGELSPTQLTLFPELQPETAAEAEAPFAEIVARLTSRHGAIFWRGEVIDSQHPLAERRFQWVAEGVRP